MFPKFQILSNMRPFKTSNLQIRNSAKKCLCVALLLLLTGAMYAQDRMIPPRHRDLKAPRSYETAILDYFDVGDADRFAYLVKPSFSPEYFLSYSKKEKSLILKEATQTIWNFKGNPKRNILARHWELPICDSLADSLQAMFAATVLTSSYIGDTVIGCDGTTYQFILQPGWSRVAECWSPDTNSNCGQAVAVVEKLCKAVKENDRKGAEGLIGEISRVAQLFRKYYPADFRRKVF